MRQNKSPLRIIAPMVSVAAVVACQQAPGEQRASADTTTSVPSPTRSETGTPGGLHTYVGIWVTADDQIRQELLPNGRYDEARGERESAYTGRYWVKGNRIEYADDTGFTADGEFQGDILHHGGYIFYRQGSPAHRKATDRHA
jgi:putative ligand-binding protein with streptavidin-like fold